MGKFIIIYFLSSYYSTEIQNIKEILLLHTMMINNESSMVVVLYMLYIINLHSLQMLHRCYCLYRMTLSMLLSAGK